MTDDLEGSLIDVLGRSGGTDLIQEAAEFSLDSVLSSEAAKEIPIAGTVARLYGMAVGVQGYIFAKKIRRSLTALSSVPVEERDEFVRSLDADPKHKERTAEALAVLLDRIDDLEKAPLLARAFAGLIRDEYDFATFRRLASAIDRFLVSDLSWLEKLDRPIELDGYVGDVLMSSGLATLSGMPTIRTPESKSSYQLSHLGQLFREGLI